MKWAAFFGVGLLLTAIAYMVLAADIAADPPPPVAFTVALAAFLGFTTTALGALFGVMVRGAVTPAPVVALDDGEVALASVPANHWLGVEARGGRLWLTSTALRFVPHGFNVQRTALAIPLHLVARVHVASTLTVEHAQGTSAFVVPDKERLAEAIVAAVVGSRQGQPAANPPFVPAPDGIRALTSKAPPRS